MTRRRRLIPLVAIFGSAVAAIYGAIASTSRHEDTTIQTSFREANPVGTRPDDDVLFMRSGCG